MLNYIKKHIFMIVCGLFFVLYFCFLALIFFAPRVDLQERGFVKCTKNMIVDFSDCTRNKVWCAAKTMLKNHVCDFNVVKTGFLLWLDGQQSTPWANYYFEPVTENLNPLEDEELQAYYQKHVDLLSEMEELNKKHIALEKELEKHKIETPQPLQEVKGDINEQEK